MPRDHPRFWNRSRIDIAIFLLSVVMMLMIVWTLYAPPDAAPAPLKLITNLPAPAVTKDPLPANAAKLAKPPMKYQKGDLLVHAETDPFATMICDVDIPKREYSADYILRNADGTWGWREYNNCMTFSQEFIEEDAWIVAGNVLPASIRNTMKNRDEYLQAHPGYLA